MEVVGGGGELVGEDEFNPNKGKFTISKTKNSMDIDHGAAATLFNPRGTLREYVKELPDAYHPSPSPFARRPSYHIVFSVFDKNDWQEDEGSQWADSKWYTLTLGPYKVNTIPLIPFWKGKVPVGSFKALGFKIICFGGLNPTGFNDSIRGMHNIYELQLTLMSLTNGCVFLS